MADPGQWLREGQRAVGASSPGDAASRSLLEPAVAAIMAGDIAQAVSAVEAVLVEFRELAPGHELLGGLCFGALDDYPRARHHLETAYRRYRETRELRATARCAIALAQVGATAGDTPATRGWLSRAKRLIDEVGPCVEEGYYRIALVGCEVPDVVELERSAARALTPVRGH